MRESMTPEFVASFVSYCHDAGLSKEATAELLQKQSVDDVCATSPAFAAGYASVAASVPGGLRPIARQSYIAKEAALGTNAKLIYQSLKGLGRGLFGTGHDVIGTPAKVLGRGAKTSIRRFPVAGALLTGAAGTGLGAYALSGHGNDHSVDLPTLPPGGYTPDSAKEIYNKNLHDASVGVAGLNQKSYDLGGPRRQQLEEAVKNHAPGSAAALAELQQMDRDSTGINATRHNYESQLGKTEANASKRVQDLQSEQEAINARRHAWYRAPLRWVGYDTPAKFDQQAVANEADLSTASMNKSLAERLRGRLNNGFVKEIGTVDPVAQQNKYFPTY